MTLPADAEVARLQKEVADLRAEVREWSCSECNTVWLPTELNKGFQVVLCPRCEGIVMPRLMWDLKRAEAQRVLLKESLELARERVQKAADLAANHAMKTGFPENKQWVIDQMLRVLLGPLYGEWRHKAEHATDQKGELYPLWDDGTPP